MSKLFCSSPQLCVLERQMQQPPGYRPRGGGIWIMNEAEWRNRGNCLEIVDCVVSRMQMEHLKRRIEEIFCEAGQKLIFSSPAHKEKYLLLMRGKRADIFCSHPNYAAAVFLLSADDGLWERAKRHVTDTGIYFDRIRLGGVTLEQYILFHAAKDVHNGTKHIRLSELADRELVADRLLRLIVNAFVIQKCGVGMTKQEKGVKTATGKDKWNATVIAKMIRNEKYMGDALLQKTYTVDFMTKKKVVNNGIVPQYYVEDDHEAIIPKELFFRVQEEIMRRSAMCKSAVTRKKNQKSKYSSGYALTGILLCGKCGQEYRRVTWARNGKKKIVWRCSNRLTNGVEQCSDSETLEESALNRTVMEAIHRITRNEGDFVGAFRQNVIRVIGSYGREQQSDEYSDRIKAKQEEMVALIAENAKAGNYTQEFDEQYRRIAEEISALKEEQAESARKKKLAENYEQRVKDMDAFISASTCQIPEFDNDLVRRLIAGIRVITADRIEIQFQSGIVMEQEIVNE